MTDKSAVLAEVQKTVKEILKKHQVKTISTRKTKNTYRFELWRAGSFTPKGSKAVDVAAEKYAKAAWTPEYSTALDAIMKEDRVDERCEEAVKEIVQTFRDRNWKFGFVIPEGAGFGSYDGRNPFSMHNTKDIAFNETEKGVSWFNYYIYKVEV